MKSVLPFRGDDTLMYSITYDLVTPESASEGEYAENGYVVEPTEGELQDILLEANRDYGIYKPVGVGVFVNTQVPEDKDYFEKGHEKYYTLTITKSDGSKLNQEELDFVTALLNEGKYYFDEESNRFYEWGGSPKYGIGGWIGGTLIGGFLGYQIGKAVGYGRAVRGYEGGGEIKSGDFVKKKGSNLELKVVEVGNDWRSGKDFIKIYNDVTNQTKTLVDWSDYELVSTYAEGGEIYSLGNSENTGHFGDLYEDDFLRFEEEGKIINLNSDLSADEKGGWHDYFISDDKYANEISKKLISKSGSTYAEGGEVKVGDSVYYVWNGEKRFDKISKKQYDENLKTFTYDLESGAKIGQLQGTNKLVDMYANEYFIQNYAKGGSTYAEGGDIPSDYFDFQTVQYNNGGEVRYFDRHSNMSNETRREILEYTNYPILKEYFKEDESKYDEVKQALDKEGFDEDTFSNYLYGLFDGYDYTKTKDFQDELAKIKKADTKFHSKIMRIVEEIQSYPTTEQPNNNQFGLGGLLLAGGFGAYVGYKIGRARPQKKGFDTEKKIAQKVKQGVKDVTKKEKPAKAYAGGGTVKAQCTHCGKKGTYKGDKYDLDDKACKSCKKEGSLRKYAGGGGVGDLTREVFEWVEVYKRNNKEYYDNLNEEAEYEEDKIDLNNMNDLPEAFFIEIKESLKEDGYSEEEIDGAIDNYFQQNYDESGWFTPKMSGGGATEEVQQYNYLYLKPTSNGLVLELTEEGVQAYNDEEIYEMYDLFEDVNSNSEWSYIDNAGDVGLGLTEAPVITDGYYFDDNGEFTDEGVKGSRLYVWNDYMIKDLFDTLMEQGQVTLIEEKDKYYGGGMPERGRETITRPAPTTTPTETPSKPDKDNPYLPKVKPKPKASKLILTK